MIYQFWLQLLSGTGFLISVYFWKAYRGLVHPPKSLIPPSICSENVCHGVLRTPFARIFRVPNFTIGILYYTMVFIIASFPVPLEVHYAVLGASWLVALLSLYLAWALIFKLRVNCLLCFAAHIVNVLIALLLTLPFY